MKIMIKYCGNCGEEVGIRPGDYKKDWIVCPWCGAKNKIAAGRILRGVYLRMVDD